MGITHNRLVHFRPIQANEFLIWNSYGFVAINTMDDRRLAAGMWNVMATADTGTPKSTQRHTKDEHNSTLCIVHNLARRYCVLL